MPIHLVDAVVPGVGAEGPARVEAALARCGRAVRSRRTSDYASPVDAGPACTIRLFARRMFGDGGSFLIVRQHGPEIWDLELLRALSAAADGFVVGTDVEAPEIREGIATFFAGRTVEAAGVNPIDGAITIGAPPLADLRGTSTLDELYRWRFRLLTDSVVGQLDKGEPFLSEDWEVDPPRPGAFHAADDTLETRAVLAGVEEQAWRNLTAAGGAPGPWRWRAWRSRAIDAPYIELRRDGSFEDAEVVSLSRALSCLISAVEVPGGGRPFRFAEAYQGTLEGSGRGTNAAELARCLGRAAFQVGDAPAMLFGRGDEGWRELTPPRT